MALFSRKNIESNPFGLTEDDLKGDLEDFPIGVVVRMLEEQELQGNKSDVNVFQSNRRAMYRYGGFDWANTKDDAYFWFEVITKNNYSLFYKQYPEYVNFKFSV